MAATTLQKQIELILFLNRVDCEVVNFEVVKNAVSELMHGVRIRLKFLEPEDRFFRCRIYPEGQPSNLRDLGPPPCDLIVGFQRCNGPSKPVFYLSSNQATALMECRASIGDNAYISCFRPKSKIPIFFGLSELSDRFDEIENQNEAMVFAFIDTVFTRRINKNFSKDYMITAAISELMMNEFERLPNSIELEVRKFGILYPSVFNKRGEFNLAFDSSLFTHFTLEGVSQCEIVANDSAGVSVRQVRDCSGMDSASGNLTW